MIIYPEVNIIYHVFVIYFLQPNNYILTENMFCAAKPAKKLLLKLVISSIRVICSCTNVFADPVHFLDANHSI